MYFWNIEELKSELAIRPRTDREVLPYLALFVASYSLFNYIPRQSLTQFDLLALFCELLITIVGMISIYRQNGGENGEHFLQRYLILGWVVGIRFTLFAILITLLSFGALEMAGLLREDSKLLPWFQLLLVIFLQLVFYWRMIHHIGDLARKTKITQSDKSEYNSEPN